ncbi:MAG TPA: bifunctional UDP-N-acetylglucosamine diphosphorylase/glucosamine-1-phosphate N-acetyltransferase GlmU [Clostridiaceae bacterium]|nr:bifunctional UDP-N-acetylglucosamine diphosphorylase/glucosamine-1-phosphate N-acetyltransferase GlmU [Clostridiaceae bacterium]
MKDVIGVILAAGEGKRMKSKKSKVVHKILGKAIIEWIYDAACGAGINENIVVVGFKADQVKECMGTRVKYAMQEEQLGTGHALMQARNFFEGKEGYLIVLCGDTPLITSKTIADTIDYHKVNSFSATIVTAEMDDPAQYGRIIRDLNGEVVKIVEYKDATEQERSIKEINSGIYCFNINDLIQTLDKITSNNSQGEYYLTDAIEIMLSMGLKVGALKIADSEEILGINDRVQLYEASNVLRKRILQNFMREGVTIIDPDTTYIDQGVKIGIDTVIYPGTIIEGNTVVGEDCIIGPNSRLIDATVGNNVEITASIVAESTIGDDAKIGPFAHLRPQTCVGEHAKVGAFVETKKCTLGAGTKASHLAYVGDAEVGRNVNIGCGVVFVNYDGKKKHKTIVGNNAFVGSNSNLVAPVTVGENGYIAAGSTITNDVPEYSLAIARERQVVKEGWVIKKDMIRKEKK